ncbi:MAG: serine/threonine protein kinase [Planctomycetes bacterium]|nr:serine/threonine protein kinase [Planctomycetota bacterium]
MHLLRITRQRDVGREDPAAGDSSLLGPTQAIDPLHAAAGKTWSGVTAAGDTDSRGFGAAAGNAADPATLPAALANHPRYRIQQLIGTGGMGHVYKAEHLLMKRPVAIKLISRRMIRRPEAVERFRREVETAARLAHPNIVASYDAEQCGDQHFLVMEYVNGADLGEVVRRQGPLPVPVACDYIRQAALGLQYAHEQGMVHRDIKPQNLMVEGQGSRDEGQGPDSEQQSVSFRPLTLDPRPSTVKILDFGLAKFASEHAADGDGTQEAAADATLAHLTQAGATLGTPDYIAPEQSQDSREADIRADIYSLGCTLHFALAGRPPFGDQPVYDKLQSHAETPPPPLASIRDDIPPKLSLVVRRMMAKDPADRFQSPAEVAEALQPFAAGATTSGATGGSSTRASASKNTGGQAASATRRTRRRTAAVLLARLAAERRRLPQSRTRRRTAAVLLAFIGALVAGAIIYVKTDHGTIAIETFDPDVKVIVEQNGEQVTILDQRTNQQATLDTGTYTLRFGGDAAGLEFDLPQGKAFTLRRGDKKVVIVRRDGVTVADRSATVQVRSVALQQRLAWRWRIHIPEGPRYHVAVQTSEIPDEGFPSAREYNKVSVPPGEHELTARIQKDEENRWAIGLYFNDPGGLVRNSKTLVLPETSAEWLEEDRGFVAEGLSAESYSTGAPIQLLRLRADGVTEKHPDGTWSTFPPDGPAQGVLIWLRPELAGLSAGHDAVPVSRSFQVEFGEAANQPLPDDWKARGDATLVNKSGATLKVQSRIIAAGSGPAPPAAEGIHLGRHDVIRLHVLQASENVPSRRADTPDGPVDRGDERIVIARYVVNYSDGTTAEWPVVAGQDVVDWDALRVEMSPALGRRMADPTLFGGNRLFYASWENPHPEKEITSIELEAVEPRSVTMCFAMVCEQRLPATRAADPQDITVMRRFDDKRPTGVEMVEPPVEIALSEDEPHEIAFLPDAQHVVTVARLIDSTKGGMLSLRRLPAGTEITRFSIGPHLPDALAVSLDGRAVVIGGHAERMLAYAIESGKISKRFEWPERVSIVGLEFLPDGQRLLAIRRDAVEIINYETSQVVRTLQAGGAGSGGLSQGGRYAFAHIRDPDDPWRENLGWYIWDVETGERIKVVEERSGRDILDISNDGVIAIREPHGRELAFMPLFADGPVVRVAVDGLRRTAQFLPGGRHLVTANASGGLKVWDVPARRLVASGAAPEGLHFGEIAVAPDGRSIVSQANLGEGLTKGDRRPRSNRRVMLYWRLPESVTGGRAPDYATLAPGEWIPVDPGALNHNAAGVRVDTFTLDSGPLYLDKLWARDIILRARVKNSDAANVSINLRRQKGSGRHYTGLIRGNDTAMIGRWEEDGWQYLAHKRLGRKLADFVELAFAAVGDRLLLYLDGRLVLEARDDALASGTASVTALQGSAQFKTIEYQVLDATSGSQHPAEGPHGGPLIELGNRDYFAELLHDEGPGTVTLYLLDDSAQAPVATDVRHVTIHFRHEGREMQFQLAAAPLDSDVEGESSRFVSTDAKLGEHLDRKGSEPRLVVKLNGRTYDVRIEYGHGEDGRQSHMPAANAALEDQVLDDDGAAAAAAEPLPEPAEKIVRQIERFLDELGKANPRPYAAFPAPSSDFYRDFAELSKLAESAPSVPADGAGRTLLIRISDRLVSKLRESPEAERRLLGILRDFNAKLPEGMTREESLIWGYIQLLHSLGPPVQTADSKILPPGADAKEAESVARAAVRESIAEAAGITNADWRKLTESTERPALDSLDSKSLSLVLFSLNPAEAAKKNADVLKDFRYLTERPLPKPFQVAEAMWKSRAKGYASFVQPEYITDVAADVEDGIARGEVAFKAPDLYEGRLRYVARQRDGKWRIEEFHLPNYGLSVRRTDEGPWELVKKGSSSPEEQQ